jgi:hypothetical protein
MKPVECKQADCLAIFDLDCALQRNVKRWGETIAEMAQWQ